jgi:hypothetical protein
LRKTPPRPAFTGFPLEAPSKLSFMKLGGGGDQLEGDLRVQGAYNRWRWAREPSKFRAKIIFLLNIFIF